MKNMTMKSWTKSTTRKARGMESMHKWASLRAQPIKRIEMQTWCHRELSPAHRMRQAPAQQFKSLAVHGCLSRIVISFNRKRYVPIVSHVERFVDFKYVLFFRHQSQ